MSEDFKMLSAMPMMQPRRVITRSFTNQNTEYTIRITRPIGEIDEFEEEIMALEEATENDIIVMQISSPGGSLETCEFLCKRMDDCKAPIIAELGLTVASAASALMLHADDWRIHDSSTAMIHACSYSPGWGKEVDVRASVVHTERINREWVERTYRGYLSDQEILSVLDGKDLYFYADDLRERLPKYKEYRESLPCDCGSPTCGTDLDNPDEEGENESFDLKTLIKEALKEVLDEQKTKKPSTKPVKDKPVEIFEEFISKGEIE